MPQPFDFALTLIQSGVKQMTFKRPTPAGWAVLAIGALCAVGFVDAAMAQTAAPAAAPAAEAAAPAAAAAAVPNKGDTAWMLISSALVLMMSIPGLALF
jgi:ammonium transporter, Amt family